MGRRLEDAKKQRERYRTNPEFREQRLAQAKRYAAKMKCDAEYQRLVRLRKAIYRDREKLGYYLGVVEKVEQRLLARIQERDKIATRRASRKAQRSAPEGR